MTDSAKLTLGEQELELPIIVGSEQERGLDISKLRGSTGTITLDEGFVNTGSTQSGITFLNGEQGILRYCGYAIEDIAEKCDFIDTCYLLLNGELPDEQQRESFRSGIIAEMAIPSGVQDLIRSFPTSAHPMAHFSSNSSTFYLSCRSNGSARC